MFWYPQFNLLWLPWAVVAAWWVADPPSIALLAVTFLSLGLFLVLYQRAWCSSRVYLVRYTLAISVLGLAIIPINSSWSYVIYAGSLIPFCSRGWRPVAALAALLLVFWLVAVASGYFEPIPALLSVISAAAVSVINFFLRNTFEHYEELRSSQDVLRRMAVVAERERIGRDLHDLLGHTLSLVAVKSALARRLLQSDAPAAGRELADIEQVARQSLLQVREAVTGMRATGLAAEVASARLMLQAGDVDFEFKGSEVAIAGATETALAMALREAVTNVQRHARATRVEVHLRVDAEAAELSVRDDGCGGVLAKGNGLSGMEQRLATLGGQLLLESIPGEGTLLRMRVPVTAVAA
jgi:two-component system sensor histidine kinase DesK